MKHHDDECNDVEDVRASGEDEKVSDVQEETHYIV